MTSWQFCMQPVNVSSKMGPKSATMVKRPHHNVDLCISIMYTFCLVLARYIWPLSSVYPVIVRSNYDPVDTTVPHFKYSMVKCNTTVVVL